MFLEIKSLLNPAEVARLATLSRELKFIDGRVSNPANVTKQNLQVSTDPADRRYQESSQIVLAAFLRSPEFREFALPKHIGRPLLARYEAGMKYGPHADAPHLRDENLVFRSDLSATVFLADPASYEGGELVVHAGTRPVVFKGVPGDAIVYPSTFVHEVRPVLSGSRLVSITFIESMIADEHRRTQIYELNEVAALEGLKMSWENRIRLEAVRYNLLRMWSK